MQPQSLILALVLTFSQLASADSLSDATLAMEAGQPNQAAKLLTPLANSGNPAAQHQLAMLYYMGQGVPEDENQAIYLWKKAAAQGSIDSMFQLGSAFLFGSQAAKIVPDPDREAAIWYFQAASAGHAEAQYHLGLLFLAGKGVISSKVESARWMKKAAAQGHLEAKKALGIMSPTVKNK
jgi:TPR repeat protein